jgi:hypothetical protein
VRDGSERCFTCLGLPNLWHLVIFAFCSLNVKPVLTSTSGFVLQVSLSSSFPGFGRAREARHFESFEVGSIGAYIARCLLSLTFVSLSCRCSQTAVIVASK